jgi:serine/threonine protein kinase
VKVGDYEIVRELGRGGMGVVYEARHPSIDRALALKVVLGEHEVSAEALERFRREARLLARVRHPSIVAVHALDRTEDGRDFLVADLVEGQTLTRARRDGPLDPKRAAAIVRDLALAVEVVHANGILHRDLKPDNVILRPDGVPVLLDFGLARDASAQQLTRTGVVVGTPAYMSPEQAEGARAVMLDARTDVYSLGALLFFLLAGTAPFEGATITQLIYAVLQKEPTWPADAPAALVAIGKKAMAKARDERYATAADLAADLASIVEGRRPSAASAAPRVPRIAIGVAAVVAVAAIAAVAVGLRDKAAPPPPPTPTTLPPPPTPKPTDELPRDRSDRPLTSYREHLKWLTDHPKDDARRREVAHRLATWREPLAKLSLGGGSKWTKAYWLDDTRLLVVRAWWTDHPLVIDMDATPPRRTDLPTIGQPGITAAAVDHLDDKRVRVLLGSNGGRAYTFVSDLGPLDTVEIHPIEGVQLESSERRSSLIAAFSHDHKMAALGCDQGKIFLIDFAGARPTVRPLTIDAKVQEVRAVAFTRSGRLLAGACGEDMTAGNAFFVLDPTTGREVHRTVVDARVTAIGVHGNGERVAFGTGTGKVVVRDDAVDDAHDGGGERRPFGESSTTQINGIAFCGDRLVCVTGEDVDPGGKLIGQLAIVDGRRTIPDLLDRPISSIQSVQLSDDGLIAIACNDGTVEVRAMPGD